MFPREEEVNLNFFFVNTQPKGIPFLLSSEVTDRKDS